MKAIRTVKMVLAVIGMLLLGQPVGVGAAELFLPASKGAAGKEVVIPLMVDQIDNLAGIKVVLTYDEQRLGFVKAVKTEKTANLMHVVNDRKPGLLILVMAGAKGVALANEAVMDLHFAVKPDAPAGSTARLTITEAQLMSDQLKDIACKWRADPLLIQGAATEPHPKTKAAPAKKKPVGGS